MFFAVFLWLLSWGAMFTGIYNVQSKTFLNNVFTFFQGARAFLPVLAVYLCLIWILATRPKFPFIKNPIGFLYAYSIVGILTSVFLSPEKMISLYWVGVYLAPLLVVWVAMERKDCVGCLRLLIYVNYAIFFLVTCSLFPESLGAGWGHVTRFQFYSLPFNLGQIRSNGAARFALVVIIVSAVRLLVLEKKRRFLWLLFLPPTLFLLTQTQSRTSLMGLAVTSMLFVLLRGIDWRYIFIGPVAAFVVWISGIKWRAHGQFSSLIFLTGRELTWQKALEQIKNSPFLGWGFHGDRILLQSEHMHNSYLHALIHGGIVGAVFFLAAIAGIWIHILRSGLFRRVREMKGADQALVIESILIIGFLSARSLFESTAAFYGVDLFLLIPAMAYVSFTAWDNPEDSEGQGEAP
ncbi:MAG: O-antigen ligase family protein [Candidatus Aminicenantales bacterium]